MITRLIVIDPQPDPARSTDVLVYQVPEHSREHTLLVQAFTAMNLEIIEVPSTRTPKTRKAQGDEA